MMEEMTIGFGRPDPRPQATSTMAAFMLSAMVMVCWAVPTFGQGTGSSVLLDLSRLRLSDEFKAFVARKEGQLEPPPAFSQVMIAAGKALERVEANPNDTQAVDEYYNSLKTGLVIWFDFLEAFVADEGQAKRLTGELGDQYAKARERADEAVRRYRDEAAAHSWKLEQVEFALDRMTDLANKFIGSGDGDDGTGGVGLDDEEANLVIDLVAAETSLPIRERMALQHALKAKLAGTITEYGIRELDSFKATLRYRYALANAQLSAASSIADLHAQAVETEQLHRLAMELAKGVKVFGSVAPFKFPVPFLKPTHDSAIPDDDPAGVATSTVVYAGQLLSARTKRLGRGGRKVKHDTKGN